MVARPQMLALLLALAAALPAGAVVEIATLDTPGIAQDLVLDGTVGYLADGLGGIRVFDLSDAAAPLELASLPPIFLGNVARVSLDGDRLYAAEGVGGISVIDVSNPASPTRLGSLGGFVSAGDVAGSGDYAYVASNVYPGFYVVDVSDPASPVEVASLSLPGSSVTVLTPTRLVAGGEMIDVSDPLNPVVVEEALPFSGAVGDGFGIATVPARYDLSDPGNPILVNQWLASTSVAFYATVGLTGELARVTGTSSPLAVFDVTDAQPTHPPLDTLTLAGSLTTQRIRLAGGRAYVAGGSGSGRGLYVVDAIDPAQLTQLGFLPGEFSDVDVAGSFAYAVDRFDTLGSAGLYVIDVSNPAAMTQVAFVPIQFPGRVRVSGTRTYVVDVDQALDILLVFDVSNPAAPVQIGSLAGLANVDAIAVAGSLVHLTTQTGATIGNLVILDASVPGAIVQLAQYPTTGQPRGLAVSGGRAYMASDVLEVVDVSIPFAPAHVTSFDLPDTSFADPEPSGSRLYAGATGGHVVTVDRADPLVLRMLGTSVVAARTSNPPGDAVAAGSAVLVASGNALRAFDASQPSGFGPVRLASFPGIMGSVMHVDADRDVAFLLDGRLRVVDLAADRSLYECANGLDDDGDTFVDHAEDAGCIDGHDRSEEPDCADGVDDDGDGLADFPADPSCASAAEASEAPNCDDGADGDGDGLLDFGGDPGCLSWLSELYDPACQNGLDDDGDDTIDFDGGASARGGTALAPIDADCISPVRNTEASEGCGLGGELALVLLGWWSLRRPRGAAA